jgi:two-component system CheB/CheR fusion protein
MQVTMTCLKPMQRKGSVRRFRVVSGRVAWSNGCVVAKSLRLLLVEDHADSAELLAELLECRGHKVRVARTGAAALACADAEPFDLVVSDVGLPDLDGYQLMQKLRDRHALKGIALTGTRVVGDPLDSGFIAFLTKPIALHALEQTLDQFADSL